MAQTAPPLPMESRLHIEDSPERVGERARLNGHGGGVGEWEELESEWRGYERGPWGAWQCAHLNGPDRV